MDAAALFGWLEPVVVPDFDAPPFHHGVFERSVQDAAGVSVEFHRQLLLHRNGFFAFGGLLHVLGACPDPPWHGLEEWNARNGWRAAWGRLTEGLTFFAQDSFGDQFAYRSGKVVRFRTLASGITVLHASLEEWLQSLVLDVDHVLDRKLHAGCVRRLGPLPRGSHFCPTVPISAGEPLTPEIFGIVGAKDAMERKSVLASRVVRRSSASLRPSKL